MPHHTIRRAGVVLLASALTLALVACGDDDATSAGDTRSTTTTTDTTPVDGTQPDDSGGSTMPEPPAEEPLDDMTLLTVTVAGGEVTGGGRQKVSLGQTVTIRVTSDVADHVHLHGYDVLADVGAGETAELRFDATIPGVFEVELEDAGLALLELEIS